MTACLNERRLLECFSDVGRTADLAHLRSCGECAERFARLRDDLGRLGAVLSAAPPVVHRPAPLPSFRWGWAAAVATAAFAASIVIGIAWPRAPHPPRIASAAPSSADISADLSAALFAPVETVTAPAGNDEVAYLQAALGGGWPCSHEEMMNGECDGPVYTLLTDEE